MKIHAMWDKYPDLKHNLEKTQALMEQSIRLPDKQIETAILDLIRSGGKLLRPAYLLLFSEFGKQQEMNKTIALASAVETLHTATLIHDDIIDEADTRRGVRTLQHKFSKDVAVYAGDYLFVVCFKLLAKYSSSLRSIQLNTNSMESVLLGEIGQMSDRYNLDLSLDRYIQNISGKTAELFAVSCFIGAYENGTTQQFANDCREIGKLIGISFQIVDDILDYSQKSEMIGKPVLEDIRQGVYSLPLILAVQKNQDAFLPLLMKKETITNSDIQQIHHLIIEHNGIEAARSVAADYTQKALKKIARLPNTANNTKETIYDVTESILNRTF
ncbi:polyprenyl synthetase family protein [Vagococcus acidifermentans]|uniref:Geranylgeranyl pyrophosphate synthase n=1 Tax=Vagococcus acidifermentans TaxID=564710 RepID=A0A430AMV7_9ENTE|nr:polyprenyl synthetase family protein [Vagococcus acidifermentans]RSU09406.1 geranylgeranyl pyrophosphate synthase [Vagococcus acidifermentans]